MNYRVEYNGEDIDLPTLDAALDNAKHAIASDVGPISGWSVEHDETINDWFVQGVIDGKAVGATAVVTGPEPMMTAPAYPRHAPANTDDQARRRVFTGATPADVLGMAANWLAGRPEVRAVDDLGWHPRADGIELRVYYRS
ncbi:hypothetical protein [Actinoplanes friuliensis]|jgi:hypothetical protein|uniref:Uncharacterized protein n=1 Tax=Actinoplanes friuliensis DSM 7358 TaxID=1246995 RepID=U5W5Z9_9ACTN|nr:hypothetical protein [Actinoplanes friuliensis]AGZ44544.1 hypothetical protein AFR_31420 [Actinoplanes friuliensis DSM 7358]